MASLRVIRPFHDTLCDDVRRVPGDVFEATEERFLQLTARIPGYVERIDEPEKPAESEGHDLSSLTVAQLKAMCAERGIKVPVKAKKSDIVKVLGG